MTKNQNTRELIQSHQSIRKFTDKQISEEIVTDLIESARWAPTSHHVQAYTIIRVNDVEKRKQLSEITDGQRHVIESPVFLVFVADFHKHKINNDHFNAGFEVEETENVIVGAVDVALAAENLLLTARSYGLGGVMVGAIRNDLKRTAEILNLPAYTFPVMGLSLGYPDQNPGQKPRFPKEMILHEDEYEPARIHDALPKYEEETSAYYMKRTKGKRSMGWGENMADYLVRPRRQQVTSFLKRQGFTLK